MRLLQVLAMKLEQRRPLLLKLHVLVLTSTYNEMLMLLLLPLLLSNVNIIYVNFNIDQLAMKPNWWWLITELRGLAKG